MKSGKMRRRASNNAHKRINGEFNRIIDPSVHDNKPHFTSNNSSNNDLSLQSILTTPRLNGPSPHKINTRIISYNANTSNSNYCNNSTNNELFQLEPVNMQVNSNSNNNSPSVSRTTIHLDATPSKATHQLRNCLLRLPSFEIPISTSTIPSLIYLEEYRAQYLLRELEASKLLILMIQDIDN